MSQTQDQNINEPLLDENLKSGLKVSDEKPGSGGATSDENELKGKYWLQRLYHLHPPSFLLYIALSNIVEGTGHMRMLCYLNIYKDIF